MEFHLPKKYEIVPDGFGGYQAFGVDLAEPLGGAIISIKYSPGAMSCDTPDGWIRSIKRAAIAAYMAGQKEITV